MNIDSFLAENSVAFQRFEHPAVFTCEEAERLCPPMPGMHAKNLFLRDRKGTRHFLVVVGYEKSVDLKALKDVLDIDRLSFASEDRLLRHLGVTPGSATLLGLAHDRDHAVELVIDAELWNADALLCHPLVNTATLCIPHEGIERFLAATGHAAKIINVPGRED
jgi:Ala-tRNA(Pro) deacylase